MDMQGRRVMQEILRCTSEIERNKKIEVRRSEGWSEAKAKVL